MKTEKWLPTTLVALLCAVVAASAGNLSITVHAKGQAEVVETRGLVFEPPATVVNWERVSPNLDLDSVQFSLPGAATPLPASGLRVVNPLANRDALLRRYLGKSIALVRPETGERIGGTLMRIDKGRPSVLKTDDGTLLLDPSGDLALPADPALVAGSALTCELKGELAGEHDLRLSYLTGGLRWNAMYTLSLDEAKGTAALAATLILRNETDVAFDNAKWRFLATEKPRLIFPVAGEEKRIVEYRPLGHFPEVSLPARETLRLPLLDARGLRVQWAYIFDPLAEGPGLDAPDRKLQRVLLMANAPQADALGLGVSLPSGRAKLSVRHPSGVVESRGEWLMDFTDAGHTIALSVGGAKGLTGKRTHTPFVELADLRAQEQEVTIRLLNETDVPVNALVIEHPWGRWEIPASTPSYEKLDDETVRFALPVPANGEAELRYRLRILY